MDSVVVKKDELLTRIRANRENHTKIFEEAMVTYRQMAIEELDKMLAEARAGKRIRRQLQLVEPMNQCREYDRVIAMLEMSTEDEIEISQGEFACYVLDQWAWRQQFLSSNSLYSSTIQSSMGE